MAALIPPLAMVRRTITLPESTDELIRAHAQAGESFSAAAARLVETGVHALAQPRPRYVASGEGPEDLAARAERYLRDLASAE